MNPQEISFEKKSQRSKNSKSRLLEDLVNEIPFIQNEFSDLSVSNLSGTKLVNEENASKTQNSPLLK